MQGKEKNSTRIDKQFQDHSWSEMRKILDEEMPQIPVKEDRKKRYILLVAILLIGFVSGIGTMVYVNQQQEVEFQTPLKVEKELAVTSDLIKNQASNNQNQKITNISKFPESAFEQKTIDNNDYLKNIIKNTEISKSKKRNKNSISSNSFNKNSKQSDDGFNNKQSGFTITNQLQQNDVIFETEKTESLGFIISKTALLENSKKTKKLDFIKTPTKKKWRFGITFGSYSNNTRMLAGITFGGKTTFDINRRFSIGTGLQYSIFSGYKEGSSNSRADEIALDQQNQDDTTSTSVGSSTEANFVLDGRQLLISNSSRLPISSLHYIELPVEMAYRFSKKFQIHLGAKAGYLVNANAEFSYRNSNSFNSISRLNDKDLYRSLNKFDFAASLGFGFYPSKKIGIDLRYNHGLIDFTRNDVWIQGKSNTNKNVQLSAIFLFGKR
jgi:Outer membrane protein beta-barrel domain